MDATQTSDSRRPRSQRTGQEPTPVGEWSRGRLIMLLTAAVVVAATVLGGLGYAVYLAVAGLGTDASRRADVATGDTERSTFFAGASRRDQIAAEPMLSVPLDAALPAEESAQEPPAIRVPAGTGVSGPGFVRTGFPRTPEGAIGQLAQIDIAVLQPMSVHTASEVYQAWALPGGVGAPDWWLTRSVQAFLDSSQMGAVMSPSASVTVEPAAALVKGTDGPDWATVCVLSTVTASYLSDAQIAFGHCERMQWVGGRWMFAPGHAPAPAPATWPGTALATDAGWRSWVTDPRTDIPLNPADNSAGDPADEQGGQH